ncbi:Damage-control phosphatase-like protein [Drosera capensis]
MFTDIFYFVLLAIIFVDNSGADIILGVLPFARELLRRGTQVVLAANDLPSINDVIYPELIEIISKLKDEQGQLAGVDASNLLIANSGSDFPVCENELYLFYATILLW